MKTTTQKLVLASLMAALIFLATTFFKIPSPFKGYINLGDCVIIITAWILTPRYSFFAAGIGSALADLISGFVIYAPATFIIKGLMALIAYYCYKNLENKTNRLFAQSLSALLAEIFMIFGYFVFEAFLYGIEVSLVNIPINAVQGAAGLVVGIILYNVLVRQKIVKFL